MGRDDVNLAEPGRLVASGALRVLMAEALLVPTGLLTVAYLTRRLGPEGYALYTLVVLFVGWIGAALATMLSAASVRLVSQATDWRPVGAAIVRVNLLLGGVAVALLWLGADTLADLLDAEDLAWQIRLFAFDVPISTLARGHRAILIGLGRFHRRALGSGIYWLAKLALVVLLVELGLSIDGALLAGLGASLAELLYYRIQVRPNPLGSATPARLLLSPVAPVIVFSLCLSVLRRVDLFALKALGGTAHEAGLYAAAKNLCLVVDLAIFSFIPLLLAVLSRLVTRGDEAAVRTLGNGALRVAIGLLPFAALVAAAAAELVVLLLGVAYRPAAPLLALLLVAELGLFAHGVATAILIATGRQSFAMRLGAVMVIAAVGAFWLAVPRLGGVGAAAVTAGVAGLGAVAACTRAARLWPGVVPLGTLARSVLLAGPALVAAAAWATPGPWVIVKLVTLGVAVLLGFVGVGELGVKERGFAASLLRGASATKPAPRDGG